MLLIYDNNFRFENVQLAFYDVSNIKLLLQLMLHWTLVYKLVTYFGWSITRPRLEKRISRRKVHVVHYDPLGLCSLWIINL